MSFFRFQVFLIGVLFSAPLLNADEANDLLVQKVELTISQLLRQGFSGCLLIERKGEVLLRKGYGLADRSKMIANAPEMRFDIGSVTKPIVAAAVLRLVQLEKLQLDSTLGELLSDVPEEKRGISIEQLLSHTSGISRQYTLQNVDLSNRDETMKRFLRQKRSHLSGERHEYSNANYFLLAAILEVTTQKSYEKILKQTVFQPLNMKGAGFTGDQILEEEVSPGRYEGHRLIGTMIDWPHMWAHRGATGVLCSVDDLAAFTKALHTDAILNEGNRKNWLTVRDSNYSLGWTVLNFPNRPKMIVHAGTSMGSRAILVYYPEHDATLVVLTNSSFKKSLHEWTILRTVSAELHQQSTRP